LLVRWKILEKALDKRCHRTSPDRTELLLTRRDKPSAGHPTVDADYASLSRSLAPYRRYIRCTASISTCPRDGRSVGRRRVRRHGGTARSGPQLSINRVPEPWSFPEQSCTTVLGLDSAGGPMRTRETNIIRDGGNSGESIRDRRWRLRAILLGLAETPPRARIVLKRFPGPRASGITLGKRVVMVGCGSSKSTLSRSLSPSLVEHECVCVCVLHVSTNYPLWTRREWTPS